MWGGSLLTESIWCCITGGKEPSEVARGGREAAQRRDPAASGPDEPGRARAEAGGQVRGLVSAPLLWEE